jgi:asparagine synthase (glutamine-hydrolysing)
LPELLREGRWPEFAAESEALSQVMGIPVLSCFRHYGRAHLAQLARERRWLAFARPVDRAARSLSLPLRHLLAREGLAMLLLDDGIRPLAPTPLRRAWRSLRRRGSSSTDAGAHGLNPAFANRIGWAQRERAAAADQSEGGAREAHARGLSSGLLQHTIAAYERLGARFGVEFRGPFLDRRLVELSLAIPAEQKLRRGISRDVMRRAMAGVLPTEVQQRLHKQDLSACFKLRLLERERARLDQLVQRSDAIAPYVDMAQLRGAYRRCVADPLAHEQEAMTLFAAVILALWLGARWNGDTREAGRAGDRLAQPRAWRAGSHQIATLLPVPDGPLP